MVAVGFNPRGDGKIARRRGATLEGLIARPRADQASLRDAALFLVCPWAKAHGYRRGLALRARTGDTLTSKK